MSKTSYVAALVVGVWLMVAWRWSESLIADAGLLIAGSIATLFAGWYIKESQAFAERNPGQALLDGAEFLEWSRLEAAAKGLQSPQQGPLLEIKPSDGRG